MMHSPDPHDMPAANGSNARTGLANLEGLMALLPLAELPRTGWLQAGVPPSCAPETIASHSHLVALLVLRLGPLADPALDVAHATAIAVAHDAAEAFTGDLPPAATAGIGASAKAQLEAGVFERDLPELAALAAEYTSGQTLEGRFVRLCDKLQMGLMALRYARAGHRGLDPFTTSLAKLDALEFPFLETLRATLVQELRALQRS